MKTIVTVVGKDKVGIIAYVSTLLASHNINILDVSQTVMDGYFTMMMLTDISGCTLPFAELAETLKQGGEERALSIRIQREDIFETMHRI